MAEAAKSDWTPPVIGSFVLSVLAFLFTLVNLVLDNRISYKATIERETDENGQMKFFLAITNTGRRSFTFHKAEFEFSDSDDVIKEPVRPITIAPGQRETIEPDSLAIFFTSCMLIYVDPGKPRKVVLPPHQKKYQKLATKILKEIERRAGTYTLLKTGDGYYFGDDDCKVSVNPLELTVAHHVYIGRRPESEEEGKAIRRILAHLYTNHPDYFTGHPGGNKWYLAWTVQVRRQFQR